MVNSISGGAMPALPKVIQDNPGIDANGTKHVQRGDLLAARRPEQFEAMHTQRQEQVTSVRETLENLDYSFLGSAAAQRSGADPQVRPLTSHAGQLGAPDTSHAGQLGAPDTSLAGQLVGAYTGHADQPGGPYAPDTAPMQKLDTQA
jgi:hypothetical protein